MSVLIYVVGGVSIATGALASDRDLLSLTSGPAWHTRLRRWARIRIGSPSCPRPRAPSQAPASSVPGRSRHDLR